VKRRFTARGALALAVVVAATLTVRSVRWRAEAARSAAKDTSETFLLPPAEELARMSLGYRSALADYLWAHVLVTQGLRLGERRRFETITDYLDTITSLDPDFRELYILTDTLTTMQTKSASLDDIYAVRRILEKGTAQFPNDAEMWLVLGQFVVYVAPASYLEDPAEQKRWRLEGAAYLGRAAELGSHDASIAWRAIGGARSLREAGERQATIRFYQRALAVTMDPELRADLERLLAPLLGERAMELRRARRTRFQQIWQAQYPMCSLTSVFIAGPPFDPAKCAGGTAADAWGTIDCAMTWSEWNELVDAELAGATTAPTSP